MRRARTTALALTVTAAVGAAGIVGVATAGRSSDPPVKRSLSASGNKLAFNKKSLTAPRGKVQLVFTNRSELQHNVGIRGRSLREKEGKVVGEGGVSRVTATLSPGSYTYFCGVGGHEQAGMKGTLKVPRPRR